MGNGRPSDFSQETANQICQWLSEGKSLASICAEHDMPSQSAVYRWLASNPVFRDQYAAARATQAEGYADEIIEIADSVRGGTAEAVAAARLAVDSRKWIASKLLPKKYGDRLDVEHAGEVTHKHMTLAQFAERIREAKLLSGRVVEPEAIEGGGDGQQG